jgi:hypothetical protein
MTDVFGDASWASTGNLVRKLLGRFSHGDLFNTPTVPDFPPRWVAPVVPVKGP